MSAGVRPDPWATLAGQLGVHYRRLNARGACQLRGEVLGREIVLDYSPSGRTLWVSDALDLIDRLAGSAPFEANSAVRLRVPVAAALPRGLRIYRNPTVWEQMGLLLQRVKVRLPSLDRELSIGSWEHDQTRRLLSASHARAALEVLADQDRASLSDSGLSAVRVAPALNQLPMWIEQIVGVAAAIEAAADVDWSSVAEARGLTLSPFEDGGHRSLSGELRGVRFQIAVEDGARGGEATVLRARLPPLPCQMSVTRREGGEASEGALRTGNPILDAAVTIHCADPEWARRTLASPENTGALLGVVHAWPGTQLIDGWIEMSAPGKLDAEALLDRIDAVLELARALKEP